MSDDVDFDDTPPATEPPKPRVELPEPVSRVHPADAEFKQARPVQPSRNGHYPAAGTLGRTLPHSLEAEEHLLSLCLLDGADLMARCAEAHIRPESFYSPAHGLIFEHLQRMAEEKKPIDVAVLAEELKTARQLDAVGGYAFLTQVSSRIPTTAQAGYYIEKVREQALLRETIRMATGAVEDAYNFSGGIDELLADQQARLKRLADGAQMGAAGEIMARSFDATKLIAKPDRIYSIAGVPVCTPGNLTTIYSQAKTGKSSFEAAMMSATMTNPTAGHDTLGVEGPNYAKHAVVHFDTEQSPYDWQQLVRSSLRRVGLDTQPPWLMSFTIAGLEAEKAEKFVHAALRLAKKAHGGIHSIFIDGIADLVNDPNSPDESFPLIARLHAAAIEYNTAIINILHLNPTAKDKSDKGRGHLGSQLERKCESNLTLKKEGEVTVVVAEGRQRGRPIPEGKGPAFKWSDEHGMHRSCPNPVSTEEPKATKGRKATYTFSEFKPIFPAHNEPAKKMKELHRAAIQSVPVKSESQFYNILQRFAEEGAIEVVEMAGGRGYRLPV